MTDDVDDGFPPPSPKRRPKSLQMMRVTKNELRIQALLYPERDFHRPRTRGDCANVQRPCPYVGCRYHLFLDEGSSDSTLVFNFPEQEPWDIKVSCALDLVEQHPSGMSLEQVGHVLGVSRERVRQIESSAMKKAVRRAGDGVAEELMDYFVTLGASVGPWDGI